MQDVVSILPVPKRIIMITLATYNKRNKYQRAIN